MNMKPINTVLAAALCATAFAATAAVTKAEHKAAVDAADMAYQRAVTTCATFAGHTKDVCVAEAKAERVYAVSKSNGEFKNTPKAYFDGNKNVAKAEYDLAKTKCAALAGNDKDVCVKEAKAIEVRALEEAKEGNIISDAHADASKAKNTANYKVALEKCDVFSGDAKESCVKNAKASFNK
jgi:hypothetical protein